MITSFLSLILIGASTPHEPLQEFLELIKSRRHLVRFNNKEHRHEIYEKSLAAVVKKLGTDLKDSPPLFAKQFHALNEKDREFLLVDTAESPIEAFDILTLELKNQIKTALGSAKTFIPFEDGAIWSFAKNRMRGVLGVKSGRESNILVLRHTSPLDRNGIFICDEEALRIIPFTISEREKKTFACKNKIIRVEHKALPRSTPDRDAPILSTFPSFHPGQELKVLFTIGKIPRIRQELVDWLSIFIEYWRGYTVDKIEEVSLRSELEASLLEADLVFSVLDQPLRSDDWIFFPDSQTGWKLRFKNGNATVTLLIPLTNKEKQKIFVDSPGLSLRESEFLKILNDRKKPLLYFDITDYSANRLGRWLSIVRQTRLPLFLVTSNQAHPFRRITDLIPQADLYMSVVSDLARAKDSATIRKRLEKGPQFWGTLINAYRTLNNEANFDYAFAPAFQSDPVVQEFLNRKDLGNWFIQTPDGNYHLHPVPNLN